MTDTNQEDATLRRTIEHLKSRVRELEQAALPPAEPAAEQEAGRNDQMLRAILDTCIDGIITIDHRGIIASVNQATERLFGYDRDAMIGNNIGMLMPEPDRGQHDLYMNNYLETGDRKIIGIGREVVGLKRDGTEFPLHLGVGEMNLDGERRFVGILRDLTTFKQVQTDLLHSRTLATLGEMAASVAHEIKNPLAAITGVVQVLGDAGAIAPEYDQVVEDLVERVENLNLMVKRLLLFTKKIEPEKQTIDVLELVEEVLESVRREDFADHVDFSSGGQSVQAALDIVLFQEVLRNILYNAAEAIPERGTVRVEVGRDGDRVAIEIEDDGVGMGEDVQANVFQPFFTRKSQGTGLGLAIASKIVAAHDGTISVDSRLGRGTRMLLNLPAQGEDRLG